MRVWGDFTSVSFIPKKPHSPPPISGEGQERKHVARAVALIRVGGISVALENN